MTAALDLATRWTPDGVRARLTAAARAGAGDHDLNPDMSPPAQLRAAAVLIALFDRGAGAQIVLTRRADHLMKHPGQIAFPGGRIDPDDSGPAAAALREAEEEVGLDPADVQLLGALGAYVTRTGYHVTPIIGWITPPQGYVLDPEETAEAFEAPLDAMIAPANRRISVYDDGATQRRFYEIPWAGRIIWGATAGMLVRLHAAIGDAPV